ncbi:flagellar hook assembly protein FlgD [Buttiauxella sp.]|uniref:flagellar hook assembly protein FlgD n=1 Tax=Buttiauxella sp. TaxID=1972222 RepID=UPI003C727B94
MNVTDRANYTQNSSGSSVSANGQSASGMNDMFLKLLVAQVQNQDPLNPTDGTEYVGQLAQLSQVQSMEKVASLMQNSSIMMDNLQTLTTANLVGQNVMVQADRVELQGDSVLNGRLTLEHPASSVTVHVKDAIGNEHKIELGRQQAGLVDFTLDAKKMGLPEGKYTLSAVTDSGEQSIPLEIGGTVSNVRIPLKGGVTMLKIAGLGEVPYSSISQFGGQASGARRT